jgi:hypothetical protein
MQFQETSWEDQIGDKLKSFKLRQDEKAIVHVVEAQSKRVAYVHSDFDNKIPKFGCFGSRDDAEKICCQVMGRPQSRFCLIVVHYLTRTTGKLMKEPIDPGKVFFWDIPLSKRNQIFKAKGDLPLDKVDFQITCTDEKTQKFDINVVEGCAFHEESNEEHKEEAMEVVMEIFNSMGEKAFADLNEERLKSMLQNRGLIAGGTPSGGSGFQASDDSTEEETVVESSPVKSVPAKSESSAAATASPSSDADLDAFLDT